MGLVIPSLIISRPPYYTQFMREITIQNNEAAALEHFQVYVEIPEIRRRGVGPDELVVTCGGEEIPFWTPGWGPYRRGKPAGIWVPVDLPASGSVQLEVWYGGVVPGGVISGGDVFEFFDDFDSLDGWTQTGSPDCQDSCAVLTDNDRITSEASFGSGLTFEAFSYANEQDSNFLVLWIDADNAYEIGSSDQYSSSFRKIRLRTYKNGAHYDLGKDLEDFRWFFRRYRLDRRDDDSVEAFQEDSSIGVQSSHTISGEMNISFNVWDSSQESTLWIDWVLVRKYTANQPTVTVGPEKKVLRRW